MDPRKRQRENDNHSDPPRKRKCKRQWPRPKTESTTKITDLNDDCLMTIFGHLDLRDLFNVTVANEWLRPAAGVVYKRKLGTHRVLIKDVLYHTASSAQSFPHLSGEDVNVFGLKASLQYLRCLGSTISELSIWYDNAWNKSIDYNHIHRYISEYCTDNLVHMEFNSKPSGVPITHFQNSFVNVRTVEVYGSNFGNQLSLFSQWFPNVRKLVLLGVRVGCCSTVAPLFMHLHELHIEINNGKRGFPIMTATHLLKLCPELHSLVIRARTDKVITLNSLSNIIKDNPNICKLKVNLESQTMHVIRSDIQRLLSEHPTLIELQLIGYKFSVDAAFTVMRKLTSLKLFQFQVNSRLDYACVVSQLDNQWLPLLDECSGNLHVELQR